MIGDEDDPFTAEDWIKKAKENLKAARVLSNVGLQNKAFVDAGMAIECALKYAVMRATGMNSWPAQNARRDLYTHDLPELARVAGLEPKLLENVEQVTSLGLAWMVVKDWNVGTRYSKRRWLLLGSGVVLGPSRNQTSDEGAEQGFATPACVVHELEKAEV